MIFIKISKNRQSINYKNNNSQLFLQTATCKNKIKKHIFEIIFVFLQREFLITK